MKSTNNTFVIESECEAIVDSVIVYNSVPNDTERNQTIRELYTAYMQAVLTAEGYVYNPSYNQVYSEELDEVIAELELAVTQYCYANDIGIYAAYTCKRLF